MKWRNVSESNSIPLQFSLHFSLHFIFLWIGPQGPFPHAQAILHHSVRCRVEGANDVVTQLSLPLFFWTWGLSPPPVLPWARSAEMIAKSASKEGEFVSAITKSQIYVPLFSPPISSNCSVACTGAWASAAQLHPGWCQINSQFTPTQIWSHFNWSRAS